MNLVFCMVKSKSIKACYTTTTNLSYIIIFNILTTLHILWNLKFPGPLQCKCGTLLLDCQGITNNQLKNSKIYTGTDKSDKE